GFVYLAVVLDWFSRRVLAWRLSITMEAAFCVETLEDAMARHGKPEIFNTDQGSQFTGAAFTGVLARNGIAISMDGKGAWPDNGDHFTASVSKGSSQAMSRSLTWLWVVGFPLMKPLCCRSKMRSGWANSWSIWSTGSRAGHGVRAAT